MPTAPRCFSIHALLAESDSNPAVYPGRHLLFYPRSPCGERRDCNNLLAMVCLFYPRSPCGERRFVAPLNAKFDAFLSTLSLRRATSAGVNSMLTLILFYPRSPCGERPDEAARQRLEAIFLSTLSLRRATRAVNMRSPAKPVFFIHALLAESDNGLVFLGLPQGNFFYPRSPCGERQPQKRRIRQCMPFFIHALLAESDKMLGLWDREDTFFYPRSPCGERRLDVTIIGRTWDFFYPRSPCGERQLVRMLNSPHSLFYPRSPCGERRDPAVFVDSSLLFFSIHALLAESDLGNAEAELLMWTFLSTLSLRRATGPIIIRVCYYTFFIHALLAESDKH